MERGGRGWILNLQPWRRYVIGQAETQKNNVEKLPQTNARPQWSNLKIRTHIINTRYVRTKYKISYIRIYRYLVLILIVSFPAASYIRTCRFCDFFNISYCYYRLSSRNSSLQAVRDTSIARATNTYRVRMHHAGCFYSGLQNLTAQSHLSLLNSRMGM